MRKIDARGALFLFPALQWVPLVLSAALVFVPLSGTAAQTSSCQTAEPLATVFVGKLRLLYADTTIDSTAWKQNGFPFATDTAIKLVVNDSICAVAVQAYNTASELANTPDTITRAYVAAIGSTGYVVRSWPLAPTGKLESYYWFDTAWTKKQNAEG